MMLCSLYPHIYPPKGNDGQITICICCSHHNATLYVIVLTCISGKNDDLAAFYDPPGLLLLLFLALITQHTNMKI